MKTNIISIRISDEELNIISANAEKMNLSKSEYLRKVALLGGGYLAEKRNFSECISRMCNDINVAANILQEDQPELAYSLYTRGVELWQFLK